MASPFGPFLEGRRGAYVRRGGDVQGHQRREPDVLVGKDGLQPLSTATLQQTTPLRDLYQASGPSDEAKLQGLTHLTVPFGNGTGIFRIQDVSLVPGQRVRFDTAAEGVSVEVTAEGVTVSGDEQAPGGRRRLMQSEGDSGSVTVTGRAGVP